MTLLTDSQMESIRSLGKLGMKTPITIIHNVPVTADDGSNPFGDGELQYASQTTVVNGWVLGVMDRDFSEDGSRVVAIHDLTVRVPVGTAIEARDLVIINGQQYTVVESTVEYTWPEWTVVYVKKVA